MLGSEVVESVLTCDLPLPEPVVLCPPVGGAQRRVDGAVLLARLQRLAARRRRRDVQRVQRALLQASQLDDALRRGDGVLSVDAPAAGLVGGGGRVLVVVVLLGFVIVVPFDKDPDTTYRF